MGPCCYLILNDSYTVFIFCAGLTLVDRMDSQLLPRQNLEQVRWDPCWPTPHKQLMRRYYFKATLHKIGWLRKSIFEISRNTKFVQNYFEFREISGNFGEMKSLMFAKFSQNSKLVTRNFRKIPKKNRWNFTKIMQYFSNN